MANERERTIRDIGYYLETLHTGTAVTASGTSTAATGFGKAENIRLQLAVMAVSGTSPTLDVLLQDTVDGSNWNTIATFTQATGTGTDMQNVTAPFGDQVRLSWTVGGTATPTFTFTVKCHSERSGK